MIYDFSFQLVLHKYCYHDNKDLTIFIKINAHDNLTKNVIQIDENDNNKNNPFLDNNDDAIIIEEPNPFKKINVEIEMKEKTNDGDITNSNPYFTKNTGYGYENTGFFPGYSATFNANFFAYPSEDSLSNPACSSNIFSYSIGSILHSIFFM